MHNRETSTILIVRIYTNKSWSHSPCVVRPSNVICSSSTISNILLNPCMIVKWISDKATQAAHAFNIRLMKSEWNPVPLNSHTFHIYWSHLVVSATAWEGGWESEGLDKILSQTHSFHSDHKTQNFPPDTSGSCRYSHQAQWDLLSKAME